jgi:hypothetical protein
VTAVKCDGGLGPSDDGETPGNGAREFCGQILNLVTNVVKSAASLEKFLYRCPFIRRLHKLDGRIPWNSRVDECNTNTLYGVVPSLGISRATYRGAESFNDTGNRCDDVPGVVHFGGP